MESGHILEETRNGEKLKVCCCLKVSNQWLSKRIRAYRLAIVWMRLRVRLRSGQLLNGEAIQLLANSVSQISSIIAELQAKAKPSTDDLSGKNREKSLEEKIEQFEYAKSTNTNTDNPIVIEQSEQLMASNNANSDECTPLIEKNTLEKTLEISDNQEGISTLNGLIDDLSDNNIKTSYAKAAKSHLDLSNPFKTPIKSAKDKLSLATNAKENTLNSE